MTSWSKAKLLWDVGRGQRGRYLAAMAALAVGTVLGYGVPLFGQAAIDGAIARDLSKTPELVQWLVARMGGPDSLASRLWLAALAMAGLTALAGLLNYLRGRWSAQAAEATARALRDRLYDHLQHLPSRYFDQAQTGDLIQRCTQDVDTVRGFLAGQVIEVARAVFILLGVVPIMLVLSPAMTGVAMILVLPIALSAVTFFGKVRATFKLADEADGQLTTVLQENLTGIRVVRAFARHDFEQQKFADRNATLMVRNRAVSKLMAFYWSGSDFLCLLQTGLVVLAGAYWVMHGQLSVGTMYTFVAYVGMFLWPMRQMGRILADLGKALVALGRLEEILSAPREAPPADPLRAPDGAALDPVRHPLRGQIVIRDLRFAYDRQGSTHAALDGVSLRVEPGQTLGLLGPSGSGKSTLIRLLLRMYDYREGSILLDGMELSRLERRYVRGQVATVLQEPFLYARSVRANIAGGHEPGEDGPLIEAARAACVHDAIAGFEQGYQTLIGERGITLSGGQRQRVAIARALVRECPILVLDDSLSAVDTQTEVLILEALRQRARRQTTILIAHRLATLMHADVIVVLDKGRVIQQGTHAELIEEPGMYRRLWQIQTSLAEQVNEDLVSAAAG